jgi:hypothetical protein
LFPIRDRVVSHSRHCLTRQHMGELFSIQIIYLNYLHDTASQEKEVFPFRDT